MKYLVTGGAGFIGSNLIECLLERGEDIICIDNFDTFYDPSIKRKNISKALLKNEHFVLYEGDIRDKAIVKKIFNEHSIDTVIHLAARAGVRPSLIDSQLYYDVNVMGTLNILENMQIANVTKMLFASSSSVYGNSSSVPFSETDPVAQPISPYAATKRAGELLCYTYSHLYKFDIWCMRFFTVYGHRQRPEMAISLFTNSIKNGQTIKMYGQGDTLRDYTYIDDIIGGIVKALDKLKGYEVINLGESRTISLKDLVRTIEKHLGKKAIIVQLPEQLGDVRVTYANIEKAKKLFHYNPSTTVDEGIKKFVNWLQIDQ